MTISDANKTKNKIFYDENITACYFLELLHILPFKHTILLVCLYENPSYAFRMFNVPRRSIRSTFDLLNPEEIREESNKAETEFKTLTQSQVSDERSSVYLNNRKQNKSVKFHHPINVNCKRGK